MAAYRMTPHSSTGIIPNRAMLGREVMSPCTLIVAPPEDPDKISLPFNVTFRDNLRNAHERARNATHKTAKTQKNYFDSRVKAISFTKGQLVWLYWPRPLIRQQKRKLKRLWVGPYRVTNFKTDVVVVIQHIKTGQYQTVHVDRLVPCNSVPDVVVPPRQPSTSSRTVERTPAPVPVAGEHQTSTTDVSPLNSPATVVTRTSGRRVPKPARYRQ